MNLATLAIKNVGRNKLRVILTVLGAGFAVLAFLLLRTVLWSWSVGIEAAPKDRLATRHKVSFTMQLPIKYIEEIRTKIPEVKAATHMNWFGGKDPTEKVPFFANLAVDAPSFLAVYTDVVLTKEACERWFADPQGAILGDLLAQKLGVKEGDKVTLTGSIYPGDWEFHVSGIYTATSKAIDRSQLLFHYNYLNNWSELPARSKDQIGWVGILTSDPAHSAEISAKIDKLFEDRDEQTLSMSERQLNNEFMGMFSAVLKALNVVSFVILLIMALILGNTIAMGVRERTSEYAVLRAIGFEPRHIVFFIIGEALFIGLLGGLVGLGFGLLIVNGLMAKVIEEQFSQWFPYFTITAVTAVVSVLLAVKLAVVASVLPAWRAAKLQVVEALRKVG